MWGPLCDPFAQSVRQPQGLRCWPNVLRRGSARRLMEGRGVTCSIEATELAQLAARGPRYTSYPPATELGPIAIAQIDRELAAVRADGPASLYVHVPFCRSLCWYCGCNVIPTRDVSRGDQLRRAPGDRDGSARRTARSTVSDRRDRARKAVLPNFLPATTLRTLVEVDRAQLRGRARCVDRSIRLDPRTTSAAQLEELGALGFKALSVGVQDFAQPVQDAIHRHQSRAQTAWLIEQARRNGFTDLNLDIVYGLPRQTEYSFRTDGGDGDRAPTRSDRAVRLRTPAEQVAPPTAGREGRPRPRLVRARATLLLAAIDQPSPPRATFTSVSTTSRGPALPLALAAVEHRLARARSRATSSIAPIQCSASGCPRSRRPGACSGRTTSTCRPGSTARDRVSVRCRWRVTWHRARPRRSDPPRALIERLMCDGRVELAAIGADFGIAPAVYFAGELVRLEGISELATFDPATDAIETTPMGRLLVRNVCMIFDRYQREESGVARFSSTI